MHIFLNLIILQWINQADRSSHSEMAQRRLTNDDDIHENFHEYLFSHTSFRNKGRDGRKGRF